MIVCCRAWYEMHGIPKTSFYRYKEKFESGVCQYLHGNTGVLRRGLQHTSKARALLDEFVNMNSKISPQKNKPMLDVSREIRLSIPSNSSKLTFKMKSMQPLSSWDMIRGY